MEKIKEFDIYIDDNSLILLCVLKNERIYLEYFITYYLEIGITHFIFIDNGSTDGSFEYLLNIKNINCMLFRTYDSYRENKYGVQWINNILLEYCKNKWCLTVDIDELLILNDKKLIDLKENMIKSNSNILSTFLLDLYPKNKEKLYKSGDSFLTHSNYYDKMDSKYYLHENISHRPTYITGGVRHRLYDVKCCLLKNSFFKFDFYDDFELNSGYHSIIPRINNIKSTIMKYHIDIYILLHFKFIRPNYRDFLKTRINDNQDWDNSLEYKAYFENINKEYYDKNYSNLYENKLKLYNELKINFFNTTVSTSQHTDQFLL